MTPRLLVPLLATLLLLALGTTAVACGDGGLSLDEYFQRVDELDEATDAQLEELQDAFPGAYEQPAPTRDFFNAALPIFTHFVDALDEIDPPSEVEDAHNEAVASGRAFTEALEDFADRLAGVETSSELEDLFSELDEDPEFTAAEERFDAACFALQDIADANDIEIELDCED